MTSIVPMLSYSTFGITFGFGTPTHKYKGCCWKPPPPLSNFALCQNHRRSMLVLVFCFYFCKGAVIYMGGGCGNPNYLFAPLKNPQFACTDILPNPSTCLHKNLCPRIFTGRHGKNTAKEGMTREDLQCSGIFRTPEKKLVTPNQEQFSSDISVLYICHTFNMNRRNQN